MKPHEAPAGSIWIAIGAVLWVGSGNDARAQLDGREALAVSYRPAAVELADLDGDLDLDLIVVSTGEFAGGQWNGCRVHVFRNPGDGTFSAQAPDVYTVADAPYGLAVADLDGDEDLDLALPHAAPDLLQVLWNDGSGALTAGPVIPVQADPVAVVAVDLDGDGLADLASADQFGFGLSVALNLGGGGFAGPQFHPLGDLVNGLQAGDVDQDQDRDLVAFTASGAVLLRNAGGGAFGAAEPLGLGTVDPRARLAHLDADAVLDLVAADRVWRGQGDGGFDLVPIATGLAADHVRCLDFDGDGHADVVAGAGVALGDGAGGFTAPFGFDPPPDSGPVAVGDFTGDTLADLVRLQGGIAGPLGFAALLPGRGDGTVPVFARVPAGDSVWGLAADDLDGDESLDLLAANIGTPWGQFLNGSVAVLSGDGAGGLAAYDPHPAGDYVRGVWTGDFTGDGRLDAVATNFGQATVSLLAGDGAGGVLPPVALPAGANPEAAAFADFDGDENLDLAVTNYGLGATPAAVTILYGDGTGGVVTTHTIATTTHAAVDLVAEDLDGNDAPDLALAAMGRYYGGSWTDYGVFVYLNRNDGTFGPEQRYETAYQARTVNTLRPAPTATPDLVATTHGPTTAVLFEGEVLTLRNDGAGHFGSPVATPLTHDHFTAVCEDFNSDGHADLAVPCQSCAVVTLLWGDGTGAFPQRTHYATGADPRALAAGDFDRDGRPDLAVGHGERSEAGLILSAGAAAAAPAIDPHGPLGSRGPIVLQAYPNPGRDRIDLTCELPRGVSAAGLRIDVFDVSGRCVAHLRPHRGPGEVFRASWDLSPDGPRAPAKGIYTLRLAGGGLTATARVLAWR